MRGISLGRLVVHFGVRLAVIVAAQQLKPNRVHFRCCFPDDHQHPIARCDLETHQVYTSYPCLHAQASP